MNDSLEKFISQNPGRSVHQLMRFFGSYLGGQQNKQSQELLQIWRERRHTVCI